MTADTAPLLRIWQQNINKSAIGQQDLLSKATPTDFDIIALQEPALDHLSLTRGNAHWRAVYPSVRDPDTAGRLRSVLFINKKLSTNAWSPITISHPDVTAITIKSEAATVHIFNLYVDGDTDTAIRAAARAARRLPLGEPGHELVWLGDFNRHHPAWDDPENTHLFTTHNTRRAEVLINCDADLGLEMALPPTIPTLEATRTKNLTRPDNVFCTETLLQSLRSCSVAPELRPTRTDHFPILTGCSGRRQQDFLTFTVECPDHVTIS